jgi:hypothetical protein
MNDYTNIGKIILLKEMGGILNSIFNEFEKNSIPYIVLRKYQLLPEKLIDEDVDLLIPDEYMGKVDKILLKRLKKHGFVKEIAKLFIKYYRKLTSSPELVLHGFDKVWSKLLKFVTFRKDEGFYIDVSYGFRHYKYRRKKLKLDIWNHLAYYSPSTRVSVRSLPKIEELMIKRRIKFKNFYTASPPDELLHVICRILFDYKGELKPYYSLRLKELAPIVYKDYRKEFKELLDLNFYKAGDMLFNLIEKKDYNNLLRKLERFADY